MNGLEKFLLDENYYYELLKGRIGDDKKDENNKKFVQTG